MAFLPMAAIAMNSQAQTRLWNASQGTTSSGFFASGAAVLGPTTVEGEAAQEVQFSGLWGQVGQTFTTPQNWSSHNGLSICLQNMENFPVEMGFRIDRNSTGSDRTVTFFQLRPGESAKFLMDFRSNARDSHMQYPFPAFADYYKHTYPDTNVAPTQVFRWQIYHRVTTPARLRIASIYGQTLDTANVGIIDGHGQLTSREWVGKVTSQNCLTNQAIEENTILNSQPSLGETWGSRVYATTGTGKWRTFKTVNGKRYFATPSGKLLWSFGVTSVSPGQPTVITGREHMFTGLPDETSPKAQFYGSVVRNGQTLRTFNFYSANLYDKYGADWYTRWTQTNNRRLASWGINTLGSGSDAIQLANNNMPIMITQTTSKFPIRLAVPKTLWGVPPDAFASNFVTWMTNDWRGAITGNNATPNFMGVYVDGEAIWGLRNGTLSEKYQIPLAALKAPATQPSKVEFLRQMMIKYVSVTALNATWGTNFASWDAFKNTSIVLTDAQIAGGAKTDLSSFLFSFANTYYTKVKAALNNLQCKGLFMGSKDVYQWAPDEVFNAACRWVDVISVDVYCEAGDVPWGYFNSLSKPVLISEFSFMGRDMNSPAQTLSAVETRDQTHRASNAQAYLRTALAQPNIIGAHWFTFVDEPISGRTTDSENCAWGLVDVTDRPYQGMANMFRSFATSLYSTRGI